MLRSRAPGRDPLDELEGQCACGGACRDCAGARVSTAPQIVDDVLARPAEPLPVPVRSALSRGLAADLDSVRIHTDELASESARRVGADAYAAGEHVVFAGGPSRP
jgi:Domain of unknown function (DUF4157)